MKKTLLLLAVLISFTCFSQISNGAMSSGSVTDVYDGPPPPPPFIPYLKLNVVISNEFTRQLTLAFLGEATDGADRSIEDKNMHESLSNDVSFCIESKNYISKGVDYDLSKKIPLSIKATVTTTFKFHISEIVDLDESQPIYIYDSLDRSYHDIKDGTYEVLVAPGTFTERFKISFTNQVFRINGEEIKGDFFIAQDNANQILKAINPNNEKITSFILHDTFGRAVLSNNNLGAEQDFIFSTSGLSSGIYVATFLTVDNSKITKKLMISNSGK